MRQIRAVLGGLSLLFTAVSAPAFGQSTDETVSDESPASQRQPSQRWIFRLHSGLSYTEGDYGHTVKTEVIYVPISLRVRHGPWRARVSSSYINIDGPASIIDTDVAESPSENGGAGLTTASRSGLGDISVMVGRRFDLSQTLRLNTDLRIKFPTASESERLTTGTTDVTVRSDLSQRIGNVTLRAGGRRRFAGGEGRVVLRDTWGFHAGANINLGDGIYTGADYNWRQSSYSGNSPNSNAIVWVSAPINSRLRLTAYGGTGFTSNSADMTVGASVSIRLD